MGYGMWFLIIVLNFGEPTIVVGPFYTQQECINAYKFDLQFTYSHKAKRVTCLQNL